MPVGWNDTFDGNTDFSAVATFNMFIDAMNERFNWTTGFAFTPLTNVAAGDDFQASGLITQFQNLISAHIDKFSKVVAGIDGSAWSPGNVLPPGAGPWTWTAYKAAYMGGNEWTRKYPREFATAAATAYLDGSAFANGHVARNVQTGVVFNRTVGAWVAAAAGTLPDTVTAYGFAQAGDFIGSWLFTEIRDALNRMIWIGGRFTNAADGLAGAGNVGTNYHGGSLGGTTSWAVAKADADTDYGTDPGAADDSFTPLAITTGNFNHLTGFYDAFASRTKCSGRAYMTDFAGVSQVDMYLAMDAPANTGVAGVYDDQGEGFTYRTWKKFDTQTKPIGGASSIMSATVGTAAEPNWCGVPGDPPPTSQGYRLASSYVIQRFDVAGGFTYRP